MKKVLFSISLSFGLIAQAISPIPLTFAEGQETKITIENEQSSQHQRAEELTQFLTDYQLIENCLNNHRRLERRPIQANIALCSVLQVFGTEEVTPESAWGQNKRLRLLPTDGDGNESLNHFEYLKLLFNTAGVTISPLSQRSFQKEFRELRIRVRHQELKTLGTAFENGIIPMPTTQAEATLLQRNLRMPVKISEAFGYLYQVATSEHSNTPTITITPIERPEQTLPLEGVLKEIVRILKDESYYNEKFDEKEAMEAAIKALVKSLEEDKYIEYYTEDEFQSFSDSLNGNLEGIGAYIEEREGKIIIVSPIHESPAEKGGLEPEDVITHIDGKSTEGLTLQEAVDLIRGPQGTSVILTIMRNGRSMKFTIVREKIDVPTLTTQNKQGIEIIKLIQFGSTAAQEMKVELERVAKANPRGLIIDLRNNPGGFLDQVVEIVDYFIGKNQAVVYLDNGNARQAITSSRDPIIKNIPVAVLINKGSASASEILAGALKAYGVADIYGETSFGKGTVQNIVTLRDQSQTRDSAFKFTTSEYLVGAPNDEAVSIDGIGVVPDSNPVGQNPLIDNKETPQVDEALEAVINQMR